MLDQLIFFAHIRDAHKNPLLFAVSTHQRSENTSEMKSPTGATSYIVFKKSPKFQFRRKFQ